MKKSLLISLFFLITATIASTQEVSDYYPMQIGNYWIALCDTFGGEYNPTTFKHDVEGIDEILGEECFRIKHSVINGYNWSSYYWIRIDTTGIILKARGDTSVVDSATFYDPPLPYFPNEMFNVGFTWEWDISMFGFSYRYSVESVT